LVGVYRDDELIETIESDQKISDGLLAIITKVMKDYPLSKMIYTRGPGSYMAIKLTYIILKTIEIAKKIPFEGCSAFAVNNSQPVKAIGNLYFVKEGDMITTQKFEQPIPQEFSLPASLGTLTIDEASIPNYILPAV
jgi:tRNA A37 threonylcarbamoyladenosine modification protein TsaB